MYKVSSSAVPRTALPCINRTFFYNTDNIEKTPAREKRKRQESKDISQVSLTDIRLRATGRGRCSSISPSSTPPSTPSTPSSAEIELQMSILDKSWKRFALTENGEPDSTIIQYTPKKTPPADFRPVDLDVLFAEHILREVNIDPKVVLA